MTKREEVARIVRGWLVPMVKTLPHRLASRMRDADDKRIVLVQKTADGAIYVDEFARIVEERTHGPTVGAALYG